jgi:hypothetical protein
MIILGYTTKQAGSGAWTWDHNHRGVTLPFVKICTLRRKPEATTYFLPWKYAGFRFQGAGVSLSSPTVTVTSGNGFSRSGSGSAAAGVITGDFIMRLPLDDFWPTVHLAPYIFGGGGGVFTGAGGNTINTPFPAVNQRFDNASSNVNNNRGLANIGGGFEYRFTPHIGVFGEAGYNWVGGGQHSFNSSVKDFVQTNFGLRFAF